jgi:hypothetical protein
MKKTNYLLVVGSLIASAVSLSATTVIPPTFEQLVDQAQVIFQGTVTRVNAEWVGEGADRHIATFVTFEVKDALKGAPGKTYTMRQFGGTVEGETMGISDAPQFTVGDENILFVENNGSQVVPLVGIMYGQFHVRKNGAGQELVTTNEDQPLTDVSKLGHDEAAASAAPAPAMTATAFKAAIQSRLQSGSPTQQRN